MLVPLEFITKKRGLLNPTDYEDSLEHAEFTERLRKTLYYGKTPNTDRPSLPVTELTVGFFTDVAPRELGRVDLSLASDMSRQACISPCSMMLGLIYVDRLKHRNPEYLQQVSSSDLFLISMMMASKYLYDEGVDEEVYNDEWAESAELDIEEVNTLERNFLKAIDWQLYVRQAEFFTLLQRIERRIARDKGRERGFYSYSDLVVLSDDALMNQALHAILHQVCKVMVVCSVAYVAGVLMMVASTMSLACLQQVLPVQPLVPDHAVTAPTHLPALIPSHPTHLGAVVARSAVWDVDSNGSTDNGDRHWRDADDSSTAGTRRSVTDVLGMSRLLTLAFLKDTVVQFVAAMTLATTGNDDKSSGTVSAGEAFARGVHAEDDAQDVVCTCGCCESSGSWTRHCVNVSMDYDEDARWHGHVTGNAQQTHGQWGSTLGCRRAAGAQCCCRSLVRPWTRGQLETKSHIDGPFHNVVLGFGTTADAVVSG